MSLVWNVITIRRSTTRQLPGHLTLGVRQGETTIVLSPGKIRLEMFLNEDDTGGFYSVRILSENAQRDWALLADLHFGTEPAAADCYDGILAWTV